MPLLLVELSGEHAGLAAAEVEGALRALGPPPRVVHREPRLLVVETGVGARELAARVALAHAVGPVALRGTPEEILAAAPGIPLPPGSVAVRAVDLGGGPVPPGLPGKIGARLGRPVDLEAPDVEVRLVLGREAAFLTVGAARVDRPGYEARKVACRPFVEPISLHPRFARALVNLAEVRSGESLADPFCGTGGILVEAALVGARPLGSDLRPRAVEGSRAALEALGLAGEVRVADVGELPRWAPGVCAIATDPPYGRSTTTGGEPLGKLYARAFRAFADALAPGRRAAVVLPRAPDASLAPGDLEPTASFALRVHRSLTRHFCVFRRA